MLDVMRAEVLGDLANISDEDKTAHPRIQILQRVHKLQHEARCIAYRIRDIAQDHNLRLFPFALVKLQVKGHAAVLEVLAQCSFYIEAAFFHALASDGNNILQPFASRVTASRIFSSSSSLR